MAKKCSCSGYKLGRVISKWKEVSIKTVHCFQLTPLWLQLRSPLVKLDAAEAERTSHGANEDEEDATLSAFIDADRRSGGKSFSMLQSEQFRVKRAPLTNFEIDSVNHKRAPSTLSPHSSLYFHVSER